MHVAGTGMSMQQADLLEYYLRNNPFITDVTVNERTGNAIIFYKKDAGCRDAVITSLSRFRYDDEKTRELVPDHTGRALTRQYEQKLVMTVLCHGAQKLFLPLPVRQVLVLVRSMKFIAEGLRSLLGGRIEVSVLDAAAITTSVLRGDHDTASSVMFLLRIGEILEEWTHRKSVDDLARSMTLKVDRVWVKTEDSEILADVRSVKTGDQIIVRTSNVIPLDGKVVEGIISVNQASMTGESVPVCKSAGGYVYAGTVVEEGDAVIEVTKTAGSGKYDRIVRMIEESEKLKSGTETKAFHLADRLVPYSLGGTLLTWLVTRDLNRALSFLMVDFSCALKLSMPLSVLSAIRESGECGITVKGGKFLEAVAMADTVVFDKTGTLTHAAPQVVEIVTFGSADETECLRLAACLEEHYPHSIANAVVREAQKRGIVHDEMHSSVQYVVAHGISSTINGKKALIGSYHFVFEDEGCRVPEGEEDKLSSLSPAYSHLFLALDGVLIAVLCIFDPLRSEAAAVIDSLHAMGIRSICMMTGDNVRTARAIAQTLNIDAFQAEVLPDEKADFIRQKRAAGHTVIMVGDGVNDSPALSEADAGIAISDGAAIAREVADITISSDSLYKLLVLRKISERLMRRIRIHYRFIISFNALLIMLGVAGVLPPASSALLHNGSTILTGLQSMTDLLDEQEKD